MSEAIRHLCRGLLIVFTAGIVGCASSSPTEAPDREASLAALHAADSAFQAAVVKRDLDSTTGFYAEDAVMLPVAEPLVEGRAAIRSEWAHVFGIPGYSSSARVTAVDVAASGDLGYTRGTYESPMLAPDGRQVVERGKWVSVWRRAADGAWRITVDVYNTDSPPPDHQASTAESH